MPRGPIAVYATGSPYTKTGPGKLLGLLVSHDQAAVQTLTFYDNTAASGPILTAIDIAPEQCPAYLMFPRDLWLQFDTGLTVDPGHCHLTLWIIPL